MWAGNLPSSAKGDGPLTPVLGGGLRLRWLGRKEAGDARGGTVTAREFCQLGEVNLLLRQLFFLLPGLGGPIFLLEAAMGIVILLCPGTSFYLGSPPRVLGEDWGLNWLFFLLLFHYKQ